MEKSIYLFNETWKFTVKRDKYEKRGEKRTRKLAFPPFQITSSWNRDCFWRVLTFFPTMKSFSPLSLLLLFRHKHPRRWNWKCKFPLIWWLNESWIWICGREWAGRKFAENPEAPEAEKVFKKFNWITFWDLNKETIKPAARLENFPKTFSGKFSHLTNAPKSNAKGKFKQKFSSLVMTKICPDWKESNKSWVSCQESPQREDKVRPKWEREISS